jgi:hypothetical protein
MPGQSRQPAGISCNNVNSQMSPLDHKLGVQNLDQPRTARNTDWVGVH